MGQMTTIGRSRVDRTAGESSHSSAASSYSSKNGRVGFGFGVCARVRTSEPEIENERDQMGARKGQRHKRRRKRRRKGRRKSGRKPGRRQGQGQGRPRPHPQHHGPWSIFACWLCPEQCGVPSNVNSVSSHSASARSSPLIFRPVTMA